MKLYRSALLCVCVMVGGSSKSGEASVPSRDDLLKLVQSYRAKVSDIDVRWTYAYETLADDPAGPPRHPIPKSIDHLKQCGPLFVADSLTWHFGQEGSTHTVWACDGVQLVLYTVDYKRAQILPVEKRTWSGNWIYNVLKWPQQPPRSPANDLALLLAADGTSLLPDTETLFGAEMVVLDCSDGQKVWLDVQHGGLVRKSEAWRFPDGPLLRRFEVPEVHDVNGVFLPARIVQTGFASEKNPKERWNTPIWRFTLTIPKETLKINSGFTKKDFQLDLPPGTEVFDRVKGTNYTVGPAAGR